MTDPTMHLLDYLSKFGLAIDSDFLREGLRVLMQSVIEAEVTQRVGAQPYERTPERTNQRMRQGTAGATGSGPTPRGWASST